MSVQFEDVDRLTLVESASVLHTNAPPERTKFETGVESFGAVDEAGSRKIRASLRILSERNDGSDLLLYEGRVSYFVNLREGRTIDEAGEAALVAMVWPLLRAGLVENAARFGQDAEGIEISLAPEQLQRGPAVPV